LAINSSNKKVAIIGGGLAGCVLALRLYEQNFLPVIYDEGLLNASRVAAGMWNPLVFKRITPSWMAETLINELFSFYTHYQALLNTSFFYPLPIYKYVASLNEQTMWEQKANDSNVFRFTDCSLKTIDYKGFQSFLGYIKINESGYINTQNFLNAVLNFLPFKKQKVEYKEFIKTNDLLLFEDFDIIVFAEGYQAINNPFFNKSGFLLCKGDVITFTTNYPLKEDAIINYNGFILNIGTSTYKAGSTYQWNYTDANPEPLAKQILLDKLNQLLAVNYTVIHHEAGIRPASKDRKPIIGRHPVYKNTYIFNGLGTKGVMLAPYFSKVLAEHIVSNKPLPAYVNYARFL